MKKLFDYCDDHGLLCLIRNDSSEGYFIHVRTDDASRKEIYKEYVEDIAQGVADAYKATQDYVCKMNALNMF